MSCDLLYDQVLCYDKCPLTGNVAGRNVLFLAFGQEGWHPMSSK